LSVETGIAAVHAEYTRRLAHWTALHAERSSALRRLGNVRLLVGIGLVATAAVSLGAEWISAWAMLPFALGLVVLALLHAPRARALAVARRTQGFYQRAVARLQHQWIGTGNTGDTLRPKDHAYADDLDIFGRGGLFELLVTARTATGERTLAEWLLAPGTRDVVRARQQAVRECAGRLDLREDLAVAGEDVRAALDEHRLAAWGSAPPVRFFAGARWIALLLSLVAAVAAILWAADQWTVRPLLYIGVVELLFGLSMRKQLEQVTSAVNAPARDLGVIAVLLERLERETFVAEPLRSLQARLRGEHAAASRSIHRLRRLVEWKEWAHNQIFGVIAAPLLWTPQFAMAIERWRNADGPYVADWIRVVGEFEALSALASFAYERPDAAFPELLEDDHPQYEARSLTHALLPAAKAVANDVVLSIATPLWMISGSNMAGKSTLLRAVGLSVVLAWAGAPVPARGLRLSRLRIGASMRANDSLADHQSRFYAELRKLKTIVDAADAGEPVLFLLDELLSGTNSHDRRIGAEGLMHGLLERGAIGLATTHDLALTEIADGLASRARNLHFADSFDEGRIAWDYVLRPGVVERGNALELMRAVGLRVRSS
jgi:hypothetical protein